MLKLLSVSYSLTGRNLIPVVAFVARAKSFDSALMSEPVGVTKLSYLLSEPTEASFEAFTGYFRPSCRRGTSAKVCSWLFPTYAITCGIPNGVSALSEI